MCVWRESVCIVDMSDDFKIDRIWGIVMNLGISVFGVC